MSALRRHAARATSLTRRCDPSARRSPASTRAARVIAVDVTPLARLLRGGATPSPSPAPPPQHAPTAADETTPRSKRKRDDAPPARPVRPKLSELLMRCHREAAMLADPV